MVYICEDETRYTISVQEIEDKNWYSYYFCFLLPNLYTISTTNDVSVNSENDCSKPIVLVTNGDGIGAIGLTVLVEALVGVGHFNVHVCTPQSWVFLCDLSVSDHSMSPFETLMVSPIEINGATAYEEVDLVLGRYEGKECTYDNCWLKRQAIFSSFLLYPNDNDGICTACSFSCHGVVTRKKGTQLCAGVEKAGI
ncbi:hypothetical protein IFM89_036110 [Coptis chinensis]|uniref:Survival protein SurE-like phosphatase/nucleotidase domain-containing protein n=1 Tax=Coptis chinensis TaxID=261450 RepID=A0A835HRS0_9MAGN|nr:hypothetical protein IFM89_036110 [Coptis chinensis]